MKESTKAKISLYGWPIVYFALAIALAFSIAAAAYKTTFVRIYVSGQSMSPTLDGGSSGGARVGDTVDFGYMDPSAQAIDNAKRFNIVTTYFPYSWHSGDYKDSSEKELNSSASYKIKRIIGFPGETISLSVSSQRVCSMEIKSGDKISSYTYSDSSRAWVDTTGHVYNYSINHVSITESDVSKNHTFKLNTDEYFLMGDNWDNSSDSSVNNITYGTHIKRHNIQGILVAIEGRATVVQKGDSKDLDNLVYNKDKKYYYQEL